MEAFSDGVIAVIITIMVLELRVPAHELSNFKAVHSVFPMLVIYALSFVHVGIYWVNHHYILEDLPGVTHGILWANLAFLFTLSLIPFATAWVGERGLTPFAIALYSICCELPAISWLVLSTTIGRRTGKRLTGSPGKQVASSALYLGAIAVAYYSPTAAIAMIATAAAIWLFPPRHVLHAMRDARNLSETRR